MSIGGNEFLTAVLPVEVTDDETPKLTLASTETTATFPSDVSVGHYFDGRIGSQGNPFNEGTTATYTVVLNAQPPGDVTIDLDSSNDDALTVSPSSITFTKTGEASDSDKYEWDAAQRVTLTAVSDSDGADELGRVYHETTVGGEDYVLGILGAIVRDSGLPALTYSDDDREVTIDSEGGTATYTIVPATEPSSNLTVNLSSSDEDSVTVMPSSLTFTAGTSGNWATAQVITVTGVVDDDEFNDSAYIRHRTTFDGDEISWASVQVTVTDSNRAPHFEEGPDATRSVPENAGQGVDVGAPITAIDLNTGDTLTYMLDDPSGLFSINSSTGQITVTASNSLDYETEEDYSLEVAVQDRQTGGLTDKIEVKVRVTDVNEPPVITGDAVPTFSENGNISSRVARYAASDPERDSFTWGVEGMDGNEFTIDASGNLRFSSQPDHETDDTYSIIIVATDGGDPAERGELPVTVTVTDVDEPPEIYQGDASHDYDENSPQPVDTYSARDPEMATTTFTWGLSGTDSGDFTITNGQLQFASAPDFERPADSGRNNVYNVQVRATDDATPPKTGTFDVTITVKDRNKAPTVTGDDTLSFPEGTATTRALDRYTATDPERSPVTWSLSSRSGSDADAFRIESSGNLYFEETPDHETPTDSGGDNVYDIQVVATDDGNLGDGTVPLRGPTGPMAGTFDVTVTVTNVDEPPVVTGTTTIDDYDENGTGDVADYEANDPETAGNNNDDQVTWSLVGPDRGDFDISNSGVLTFKERSRLRWPRGFGRRQSVRGHRLRHRLHQQAG